VTGDVLVVGAGIAGFAMARALSQRDVPCTLVDRLDALPSRGMGLNLPANAVRALARLGVADHVIERGMRIRRREYRNATGRLLFSINEETFWGQMGPSICLRRGDLLRILHQHTPHVTPRWATTVTSAQPITGGVHVTLNTGTSHTHSYAVGADGIHSILRDTVTGGHHTRRRSLMTNASWRFIAPNPGIDCWTAWSGPNGTFLLIPVDSEHVYGYAASTRPTTIGTNPQWLAHTFANFPPPVAATGTALLHDDAELYHSPVEEVHCDQWTRTRLALIGDAAHATAPIWAQGAALAIQDALTLADLLTTTNNWDHVGTQYEQQRRPQATHIQAATDRMSRIAALPGWLRDTMAPIVGPRTYRAAYGPMR
jgi:2-polyprenyl-6-methoxyphenol hydroxylase-like FAD-dependent oxidoreductase